MRRFDTPENIAPIFAEIKAFYTPVNNPAALVALDCVALLQKNRTRNYMAVRTPERGGFYYHSRVTLELFKELDAWTQAAETEPGELDAWRYQEEHRIMEAVRAGLIREYANA